MFQEFRARLPQILLVVLTTLGGSAAAQVHQYVTRDNQTDPRLQIQIKDGEYYRKYSDAVFFNTSFDLPQVTLRARYNLQPTGVRPFFINACDTNFSQYYGQATNNSFREPQWQFAVRGADQSAYSAWYDIPEADVVERDPCRLTFSPARIAAMQKMHGATQTARLQVRMNFGRVLSALWQSPVADYTNISSPEFYLTPPPRGSFTFTAPPVVDVTKITDQYLVTPHQHRFFTGHHPTEYIWGLVYKTPGNEQLRYAASFPNFQYDSANFTRFLSTAGSNNHLVVGQLYPQTSTKPAFPNGVPLLPVNARPYLRVEARTKAQPYGQDLKKVFMVPHVNRPPEFEYGYIDSSGAFKNISNCAINLAECFTRNQEILFAFKVKDPDLVHQVTGGFYRGSVTDRSNRARIGRNGFTVRITTVAAQLTAAAETIVTTDFYLNYTFPYLTRIWNGIFFDIHVRDRLGGQHSHTYTLDIPDHPFGGINMSYEAQNTGRPDVRADGSGVILASYEYFTFPDYTKRAVNWHIGTTRIKTSPVGAVTARMILTPARATLARQQNVPIRLESVYQKGTIIQTVTTTMPVVQLKLTGAIDGLYSGDGSARVQAKFTPADWRHRVLTSELFNNLRGDRQLESLYVMAKNAHNINFNDWRPVYDRAGRFPSAAAWQSPPMYHARMQVFQPGGSIVIIESNLLTLQPPRADTLLLTLTTHDGDENGRATPGEVFEAHLPHRAAHAYFRGDLHWEFSADENFSRPLTTTTQIDAGVSGRYTLGTWPLPAPYLRARFTGQDKLSNTHTLTTAAWFLGTRSPGTATLRLQSAVFNSHSVLTLDTAGVRAPDGGRFVVYGWEIGPPVIIPGIARAQTTPGPTYTLNVNDFNRLNLGYEIRATAVYLDNYNHRTTVTAGRTFSELAAAGPAPTTLEFALQPPAVGAPGARFSLTLITLADANGQGTLSYEWHTRRGAAGPYQTLALTTPTYPLAAADFAPGEALPEVRLALTHHDATGAPTTFYARAAVPQHPATTALTLTTAGLTIGSAISLQAAPRDANGIKQLRYAWGTGQGPVPITTAVYTLRARDFNPARAVALTVRVEDVFGAHTTLTTAPLTIARPPTGQLSVYLQGGRLTLSAVLAVLTQQINDPNGGRVRNVNWSGAGATDTSGILLTVSAPMLTALQAGQTLHVQAQHRDALGFSAPVRGRYTGEQDPRRINQPVRGALQILGPRSFTPALTLTARTAGLTDGNGIYQIDYFWRVNYANRPVAGFQAGGSVWVQRPAAWPPGGRAPQVELKVVVLDQSGYTAEVRQALQHVDRLPDRPTLRGTHYRPGGRIAPIQPVTDANGLRPASLRHSWEIGSENLAGAATLTLTTAHYVLAAADFSAGHSWLTRVTEYEDWFGTRTTVRARPLHIQQPATARINVFLRGGRLTIGATVKAQVATLTAPNGGHLDALHWEINTTPLTTGAELTVSEALYHQLRAGGTLRVTTQLETPFGWSTRFARTLALAPGETNQPTRGQPGLTGPEQFNPGAEFTVDTTALADANGRGRFSWRWQKTLDKGANWHAVNAARILTLTIPMFSAIAPAYPPGLRAVVTHEDAGGFMQTLTTAARYHHHRAATGPLTLQAPALRPGARLTLAGKLTVPAGIKAVRYYWETAPDLLFNTSTPLAGNQPYFDLTPAGVGRARALRVRIHVTDVFNQTTELYPQPIALAQRVRGQLRLTQNPEILRPGAIITALTNQIFDANGGTFVRWAWTLGSAAAVRGASQYTLTVPALAPLAAGTPLGVQAIHQDGFGHQTTLTAQFVYTRPDSPATLTGLTLTGPAAFVPGATLHATFAQLTDANGSGTLQYQWATRGAPGANFVPVVAATAAAYTLAAGDFATRAQPEVQVVLTHHDPTGGRTRWVRTRRHTAPAATSPRLHAPRLRPGEIVRLGAPPADAGTTTYQWQSAAPTGDFVNIPAATLAHYPLTPHAEATRLRARVRHQPVLGPPRTLTTEVLTVNTPPRGPVWLEQDTSGAGLTVTAMTLGLQDPNGGGGVEYIWQVNATVQQTTAKPRWVVPPALVTPLTSGGTVGLAARLVDDFGWTTTVTTARTFTTPPLPPVKIQGAPTFAPGNVYTAVIESPPPGTVTYQWGLATRVLRPTANGAGRISGQMVDQPFVPIPGATAAVYTMTAPELPGARDLQVLVQQGTGPGLSVGMHARLVEVPARLTGAATVHLSGLTPGAVGTARMSGPAVPGLAATLWFWESAPDSTFARRTALPGTEPRYTLQFGVGNYLRARIAGRANTGATTWLTTAPQRVNYPPTGAIALTAPPGGAGPVTLRADLAGLTDPNGPLTVLHQRWESPTATLTSGLPRYVVPAGSAGAVRYVAVVRDPLGFHATLSAALTALPPLAARAPLEKLLPRLGLETARAVQSALDRHLTRPPTEMQVEVDNVALPDLSALSQLLPAPGTPRLRTGTATVPVKNSAWTFWAAKDYRELNRGGDAGLRGHQASWLVGGDHTAGTQRWGLAVGQERLTGQTAWPGSAPGRLTQDLALVLPYWEYRPRTAWRIRGVLGYGTGTLKFTENSQTYRAALAWQLAGLQAAYAPPTATPGDVKVAVGVSAARTGTGRFTGGGANFPGLPKHFAYEVHGRWENGYALTLAGGRTVRPFWAATGRAHWGAAQEALILHGGAGMDWTWTAPDLAGRLFWERQLTDNDLIVTNNFTVDLQKNFSDTHYWTWTGRGGTTQPWTQTAQVHQRTRWGAQTLIKELSVADDLSWGGKLILEFD